MFKKRLNQGNCQRGPHPSGFGRGNRHQRGKWRGHLPPSAQLLSDCKAGDSVEVQEVLCGRQIHHRLREMGFLPGTKVQIVKYAPLRDPIECQLRGYHIALRVNEAQQVIVRKGRNLQEKPLEEEPLT